jgi:hypothetical protein
MAEAKTYTFKHKEIAEALVKHLGLHEGIWGILVEFGISAANIGNPDGDQLPAAIVPILHIGLQRYEKLNSLSVDAAKVNPPPKKKTTKASVG